MVSDPRRINAALWSDSKAVSATSVEEGAHLPLAFACFA